MAIRAYPLNQDSVTFPYFGAEDGVRFYGIKPYNTYTVGGANQDGSAGYFAELGVKDNDLYNLLGLNGGYWVPVIPNTPNTDLTLTPTTAIHQLYIDTSAMSNPLYIEFGASAASTGSPKIDPNTKVLLPVNAAVIHVYSATPSLAILRGWQ